VKLGSPGRPPFPATVRAPPLPMVNGFGFIAKRSGTVTENSTPASVAAPAEPAMLTARIIPAQSLVNTTSPPSDGLVFESCRPRDSNTESTFFEASTES